MSERTIKSPGQVVRFDGVKVFAELMYSGIAIDRAEINFCQYDKSASKGSRMSNTIRIYLEMSKAAALADEILSGRLAKKARESRDKAEAKGSRYPEAVYNVMGGSKADKVQRQDGKAESRQFKILAGDAAGTAEKWIIQVETGSGHLSDTGLIVSDYHEETADKVYRLCLSSEELKRFALCIQQLMMLWTIKKFGPVVQPGIDRQRKAAEEEIAKRRPVQNETA